MKRRGVLLVTGSLAVGGTERNVVHLARSLDRERFNVEVLCEYGGQPLAEELRTAGVPVLALKQGASLGRSWPARLMCSNLPFQWRLFEALWKRRRGVVHAFGFPMAYYVVLLGRLVGARRLIFSVQDWDVWKRGLMYRWLDMLCSRLAARVVADGAGARRLAVTKQGMLASRIEVIYDGVNTEELRPQRRRAEVLAAWGLGEERCVVGVIARLDVKKKGQDHFLRALPEIAARAPQCAAVIVGGGPDEAALKQLAAELPADARPVFAGFRRDLADVLDALDILVIPSLWESVPKILLEAMWRRKAVVATTVGDIGEVLDATTGVLVPPADAAALADAVVALAGAPERRRELGDRAHEKLQREGLTLAQTVGRYEELYARL